MMTINQSSREWWYAVLLNPLKGNTLNLWRKAQRNKNREDKVTYRAAQARSQKAVKDAEHYHWHRYLANLTNKDLFTAAGYCDGPTQYCILMLWNSKSSVSLVEEL